MLYCRLDLPFWKANCKGLTCELIIVIKFILRTSVTILSEVLKLIDLKTFGSFFGDESDIDHIKLFKVKFSTKEGMEYANQISHKTRNQQHNRRNH